MCPENRQICLDGFSEFIVCSFNDIYGLTSQSLTELSIELEIKLNVFKVFDTESPVIVSLCP